MKRKIDKIKGKRLVMGGGTNTLTKDEILVTETPNGVELKERSNDGSIKEIASGGGGEDSENIKYYKAVERTKNFNGLAATINPKLAETDMGYQYVLDKDDRNIALCYIDFNSIICDIGDNKAAYYNNYPHIILKKAYLDMGMPEEDATIYANTIKELFERCFVEITKEEYLDIQNQCIAGTYIPEYIP